MAEANDAIVENIEELDKDKEVAEIISKEKAELILKLKTKHPGLSLFLVTTPRNGLFAVRPQEMGDVRVGTKTVEDFVTKKITDLGGNDHLKGLADDEREKIIREIDAEAADISNDIALKRCVIYPDDFAARLDSDEPGKGVPAGIVPLLLEKILEVSGWVDVAVEEI